MATARHHQQWRSRIVAHGRVDPRELTAHPKNWRRHPESQVKALDAAISGVGFIRSVTVNRLTGRVVDGHLRIERAIAQGVEAIDVEYVELTEAEECTALATLDPIGELATRDDAALRELAAGGDYANLLTGEDAEDEEETEMRPVALPPPRLAWVLVGIPLVRFEEIAAQVEALARIEGTTIISTVSGDADRQRA
jgi:hypothetical protein